MENKPTGKIGELIREINDYIKFHNGRYPRSDADTAEFLTTCKAQLQQAQKMKEALNCIYQSITYGDITFDAIREITKQALNEGL